MISFVIPVYNVERYLKDCVDSVIEQFEDSEIVLVDDGSTDGSGKICDEYAKKDKRIVVVHQKNAGLSAARNTGLDIIKGDYVVFVDSDDALQSGCIKKMYALLCKYSAEIVSCNHVRLKNQEMNCLTDRCKQEVVHVFQGDERIKTYLQGQEIFVMAWGKIYKSNLFEGVRYPVGKQNEDVYTTYKIVDKAKTIVTTSMVGYKYRINNDSIMNQRFTIKKLDGIEGKIQVADFIESRYSQYISYAYMGIIYACNNCIKSMKIQDLDIPTKEYLQGLYQKYGKYYVKSDVSPCGKIITIVAMQNVHLAVTLMSMYTWIVRCMSEAKRII